MRIARRLLSSFGRFWWEFLIGENPDAFVGTLAIVGAALLLRHSVAAIAVVPLLTLGVLWGSTYRGRRRVAAPRRSGAHTRHLLELGGGALLRSRDLPEEQVASSGGRGQPRWVRPCRWGHAYAREYSGRDRGGGVLRFLDVVAGRHSKDPRHDSRETMRQERQ